jgi:hypothetical protein
MSLDYIDDTEKIGDLIVQVFADMTGGDGPRDWDNVGHMLCWHPNYELGDEQFRSPEDVGGSRSMEEVSEWLIKERGAIVLLPLYLLDHSGISMSYGSVIQTEGATADDIRSSRRFMGDDAGWDTSMVGFIYATEKAKEEAPHGDLWEPIEVEESEYLRGKQKVMKPWIVACLQGEVKTYDDYLTGNVWAYRTVKPCDHADEHDTDEEIADCPHSEVVESCFGFIGDPKYAWEEARAAAQPTLA